MTIKKYEGSERHGLANNPIILVVLVPVSSISNKKAKEKGRRTMMMMRPTLGKGYETEKLYLGMKASGKREVRAFTSA